MVMRCSPGEPPVIIAVAGAGAAAIAVSLTVPVTGAVQA